MDFVRPLPIPTPTSKPYWENLNDERVVIQRCRNCEKWIFYPRSHCPACLDLDLEWTEVDGKGVLYTYTVARQPTSPHFQNELPQILAVVELTNGVRLTTTLINVPEESIQIGMKLRPVFDHIETGRTLLRYEPL